VTELVDESVVGVDSVEGPPVVPEGDESSVESNTALSVIGGTEAREAWGTICNAVSQTHNIQVPVSPDVGDTVLTVVDCGEHVKYFRAGGWGEVTTEGGGQVHHAI